MCGTPVQAPPLPETPLPPVADSFIKRLHLPPLEETFREVEWAGAVPSGVSVESQEHFTGTHCMPDPLVADEKVIIHSPALVALPEPRPHPSPTRDEEEQAEAAGERRQEFRLRFFDAALILLFLGTLVMAGAALAFTQSKKASTPPLPPELSRLVVERMQKLDSQRDEAVAEAKGVVRHWITATEPAALQSWCLTGDPVPDVLGTAGGAPADFEFIQARRLPGTEQFLTLFEVLADPPLVVPVEQTPAGPRLHGRAIAQQQGGLLAKFLASQGSGEAVFYALLRPGPAPMKEELLRSRPDLAPFLMVGVEPAFPADGSSGCLACLAPDLEAARIFAKRAHDPNLRPAVVKLAWRQHRESGNYVELVDFEPNAWSRH